MWQAYVLCQFVPEAMPQVLSAVVSPLQQSHLCLHVAMHVAKSSQVLLGHTISCCSQHDSERAYAFHEHPNSGLRMLAHAWAC